MKVGRKVSRRSLNHEKYPGKYALLCCCKEEPGELVAEVLLKRDLECSYISAITLENCSFFYLFISFNKHILSIFFFPDIVLGAGDTEKARQGFTAF